MKNFFFSLRFRITIIILLAILPSLVLFYYSNVEYRNKEIGLVKENTLAVARIISEQEKELIDGTRQLLLALSIIDEVRNADLNKCDQFLSDLLLHYKRYINFGIANEKGEVICSALALDGPVSIADRKYFKQSIENQDFAIGEYQVGWVTQKPSINFGYPIFGNDGNIKGVIFAALGLVQLSQFEKKILSMIPEKATLTKVDNKGIILATIPSQDITVGKSTFETLIHDEVLSKREGLINTIGLDGRPWVYAFTTIPSGIHQNDIHVIYGVPEAVLLADINHMFNRNIVILSILGFMLLVGTWVEFEFTLMRQIQSLQSTIYRHTQGDLGARTQILPYSNLELKEFSVAFNQMSSSIQQRERDLVQAYDSTLQGWSQAMDLRDKETEGHTQRVTELTVKLARAMGMSEDEIVHVRRGALLHDIGKLGIPDYILLKPSKLSDEEWVIMRQHPQFAFDMISSIEYLHSSLDIPYCHHEKWDGTGYSQGLKGDEIPLAARIFAIVDVWDALHNNRPYRTAWSDDKILDYIKSESGRHFYPQAVEIFIKIIKENR